MTDHEIMCAVRDGDVDRMGLLFEQHHRRLFNFFLLATGNRQVSEDLVQDVFFRMLKYRHTYREHGEFETWMYRIARNARVDYYRGKRQQESIDDHGDLADNGPDPYEAVAQDDDVSVLHKAMALLPEDKREVLVMSKFTEMKYEEMGTVLGCTVGAVKVRVHRAIRDLAEIYAKITGEVSHEM